MNDIDKAHEIAAMRVGLPREYGIVTLVTWLCDCIDEYRLITQSLPKNRYVEVGLYRHWKGGLYLVHDGAEVIDENTAILGVVYRNLHTGEAWRRSVKDFLASVVWPDGVERPRFVRNTAELAAIWDEAAAQG